VLGDTGFMTVEGAASATTVSSGALLTVVSGGVTYGTVVHRGGDEYIADGTASGSVIEAGGFSQLGNQGVAKNAVIAAGTLNVAGDAKLLGTLTFHGGQLIIDSPDSPSAVISNFTVGDQISFGLLYYSASETVAVNKAGIVTVSGGGRVYNLHIAGATVGSTDYVLSQGNYGPVLTTTVTSAAMAFLPTATKDEVKSPDFTMALAAAHLARETEVRGVFDRPTIGAVPDMLRAVPAGAVAATLVQHGTWFG
jgi:autotransporter passenger strand-loop-strand repeat protein